MFRPGFGDAGSPLRSGQFRGMSNEYFVRGAYEIAERTEIAAWIACFNPDDSFVDQSRGSCRRPDSALDAPCCDVFRLRDGRIQLFDCYPSGTVILSQLGVLAATDDLVSGG